MDPRAEPEQIPVHGRDAGERLYFVGREQIAVTEVGRRPIFCLDDMKAQNPALYALVEPVVADLGFELWGLELASAPGRSLLRVYIDSAGGITLDDCARVSRRLAALLDVEDPVRGPYDLEVSSPGLDRPLFSLAQFARYAGREVRIRLRAKIEGRRRLTGRIIEVARESLTIDGDDGRHVVPADMIESARLTAEF